VCSASAINAIEPVWNAWARAKDLPYRQPSPQPCCSILRRQRLSAPGLNEPKRGVLRFKGSLPNCSALLGLFLAPDKEGCCRHHRSQGRCRQQKQDDGGPIGVHRCGGETSAIISAEVPRLALRRSVLVAGLAARRCWGLGRWLLVAFALAMDLAIGTRTQAGVVFDNCQTLPEAPSVATPAPPTTPAPTMRRRAMGCLMRQALAGVNLIPRRATTPWRA